MEGMWKKKIKFIFRDSDWIEKLLPSVDTSDIGYHKDEDVWWHMWVVCYDDAMLTEWFEKH